MRAPRALWPRTGIVRTTSASLTGLLVTLALPALAFADDAASLRERAEAEMATGNLAEACPLLASAHALDHDPTTLFSSAKCFDQSKKLASAHAAYGALIALPEGRVSDETRRVARARHAELGPRLSHVTVRMPPEIRKLVGVSVMLDGREIPPEDWDVPHAHDVGLATVTITIPDRPPYSAQLTLPPEGADEIVDVPTPSFPQPRPPAPSARPTRAIRVRLPSTGGRDDYFVDSSTFGPYQVAGIATFATGVVGLGVGFVIGLMGAADYNRAALNCTGGLCNDRNNVAGAELARDKGDLGTGIGAAGVGLMAVGAGLYFLGPRPLKSNGISLVPRGLGLDVGGSF